MNTTQSERDLVAHAVTQSILERLVDLQTVVDQLAINNSVLYSMLETLHQRVTALEGPPLVIKEEPLDDTQARVLRGMIRTMDYESS